jgi:hypothetical protein
MASPESVLRAAAVQIMRNNSERLIRDQAARMDANISRLDRAPSLPSRDTQELIPLLFERPYGEGCV